MSQNNKNITFRRIRGRIIPIKVKKKELAEGAGLAGLGVAVSVGSGAAYRGINRFATSRSSRAFRSLERLDKPLKQHDLFGIAARVRGTEKVYSKTDKLFRAGRIVGRFAAPTRIGGQLIGATIIGSGVSKIYESINKGKKDGAAVGSSAALAAFLLGAHGGAGLRKSFRTTYVKAYPAVRLLKAKLKL